LRVTPRRVVAIIDKTFPWAAARETSHDGTVRASQSAQLGMVVAMVRAIPIELLPQDADAYCDLVSACTLIDAARESWAGRSSRDAELDPLRVSGTFGRRSAVEAIRHILAECPEQGIRAQTHDLQFVTDPLLRDNLRRDLSSTRSMLDHGEFKGATVLAGSVIEALLLDALLRLSQPDRDAALAKWKLADRRSSDPPPPKTLPSDLGDWKLSWLVWIAHWADVISERVASGADDARDFRNLIHPGKTLRTGAPADEGTASMALGAALRIAAELQ
jgi:hypothetical protein